MLPATPADLLRSVEEEVEETLEGERDAEPKEEAQDAMPLPHESAFADAAEGTASAPADTEAAQVAPFTPPSRPAPANLQDVPTLKAEEAEGLRLESGLLVFGSPVAQSVAESDDAFSIAADSLADTALLAAEHADTTEKLLPWGEREEEEDEEGRARETGVEGQSTGEHLAPQPAELTVGEEESGAVPTGGTGGEEVDGGEVQTGGGLHFGRMAEQDGVLPQADTREELLAVGNKGEAEEVDATEEGEQDRQQQQREKTAAADSEGGREGSVAASAQNDMGTIGEQQSGAGSATGAEGAGAPAVSPNVAASGDAAEGKEGLRKPRQAMPEEQQQKQRWRRLAAFMTFGLLMR